jgi:hypothetical protein
VRQLKTATRFCEHEKELYVCGHTGSGLQHEIVTVEAGEDAIEMREVIIEDLPCR